MTEPKTDFNSIVSSVSSLTPEQATQLRKTLKGKSKYAKKGIYREKENKVRFMDPDEWETFVYDVKENLRKYYWFLFLTGLRYKEAKNVKKSMYSTPFLSSTILLR